MQQCSLREKRELSGRCSMCRGKTQENGQRAKVPPQTSAKPPKLQQPGPNIPIPCRAGEEGRLQFHRVSDLRAELLLGQTGKISNFCTKQPSPGQFLGLAQVATK
jgi:hypothetical protein